MTVPNRRLLAVPIVFVLALLAGCNSSFQQMARGVNTAPGGGDDDVARAMRVDDVYLWAPNGVPVGGSAPLRVALGNDSTRPDRLLGVTAAGVGRVEMRHDGRPVRDIAVPAGDVTNLEWNTGLLLTGVRRPLQVGHVVTVTFHFANAGTVTSSAMLEPTYPGWYR